MMDMATTQSLIFEAQMLSCPVCCSENINLNAFTSGKAFLSLPGFNHSECMECTSIFVNPQPTQESLEAFYKSEAMEGEVERSILESYVSRYFDPEKRTYFLENRMQPIQKHLTPGAKVLDVGCGAGEFVRFMLDAGFDARGMDISKCSIEYGRQRLELQEQLELLDWQQTKITEKFDLISGWTLIEHLKNPAGFLAFCEQNLNSSGHVIIEFPTTDSLLFRHLRESFFWIMPPYHLFLFSLQGMEKMAEQAGFSIVEKHPMPKNWYFVSSACRKLKLDYDNLVKAHPNVRQLFIELDRLFDSIAYDQGCASSVQLILRKDCDKHPKYRVSQV